MPTTYTPLRYPGGKSKYTGMFSETIESNNLAQCTFVEVFAGGAGAAVSLLLKNRVKAIFLNDFDCAIYAFWDSILHHTEQFIELMHRTPVTVDEWRVQREVYNRPRREKFALGFATFYLNRCNHAGILTANPIGGLDQSGIYGIDARFNKETAERKIREIARRRDRIKLFNMDAIDFVRHLRQRHKNRKLLVYFDPPYFQKGQLLYLNHYKESDHAELRDHIVKCPFPWILSYDKHEEIVDLYDPYPVSIYQQDLRYSVATPSIGNELIISSLKLPDTLRALHQ